MYFFPSFCNSLFVTYKYFFPTIRYKSWFSGLLRTVFRWLEIEVSEVLMPPSSGLSSWSRTCIHCIVAYPEKFKIRSSYNSLITKLIPWWWRRQGSRNAGVQPPNYTDFYFFEVKTSNFPLSFLKARDPFSHSPPPHTHTHRLKYINQEMKLW